MTTTASIRNMIESLGRRLRVAFNRAGTDDGPTDPQAAAALDGDSKVLPLVEFVAYAEDCVLSGVVRLQSERLSDMLNDHDEVQLIDVLVEPLDGSDAAEIKEVLVRRDELVLVHASGPRGDAARRHRTRQHPVSLDLGRYAVHGYLHALPGADPLNAIRRRKAMIPMTDALIEFESHGEARSQRAGVVVVNRDHVTSVTKSIDHNIEMPHVPVAESKKGRLTKDFTGEIVG